MTPLPDRVAAITWLVDRPKESRALYADVFRLAVFLEDRNW